MSINTTRHTVKGFSLVELSIVLVILGLLVGGVLSGQALIRAAELRAIPTEYQRLTAAAQSFRDKYFSYPGDMINATSFWGTAAACPGTSATPSTDATTCNGNGDGIFSLTASSYEYFRFFQQLANAGLIEGRYSGVTAGATQWDALAGVNFMRSKLSNAKWGMHTRGGPVVSNPGGLWDGMYGTIVTFGENASSPSSHETAILKPEEAWNIDTKIDDGRPGMGKVWGQGWAGCSDATASNQNATANYRLNSSSIACALVFTNVF